MELAKMVWCIMLVVILSCRVCADGDAPPIVHLPNGTNITGQSSEFAHSFYSIPYAKPPTRFMPPEPIDQQNVTINASTPTKLACHQPRPNLKVQISCDKFILFNEDTINSSLHVAKLSEDCLVLSVHVPATTELGDDVSDGVMLPVMFWIHGGSFLVGSGNQELYDAKYLSNSTNTVVVTVNYRLGAFGFLAYKCDNVTFEGNQGLKDQQLALKWVYDNIKSFGGNQSEITVFGESAGAQSVLFHLLSSTSEPHFHRAIIQSNYGFADYKTPNKSEELTKDLLKLLNCEQKTDIECLRNAPAEDIVNLTTTVAENAKNRGDVASAEEPFRPTIDGSEFIDQPFELFKSGKWQTSKPVIIGATSEEYANFVRGSFDDVQFNDSFFLNYSTTEIGPKIGSKVAKEYLRRAKPDSNSDYEDLISQELSDVFFFCPTVLLGRLIAKTSTRLDSTVFFYLYDHPENSSPTCSKSPAEGQSAECEYAFHTSELAYLFNTGQILNYTLDKNDTTVSSMLAQYWGSFATGSKPTAPHFVSWPEFKLNANNQWPKIRIEAPNTSVIFDHRREYCEFLESLNYYYVNDPSSASVPYRSAILTILAGFLLYFVNLGT